MTRRLTSAIAAVRRWRPEPTAQLLAPPLLAVAVGLTSIAAGLGLPDPWLAGIWLVALRPTRKEPR